MALKRRVFVLAFVITLFLFASILVVGGMLSNKREAYINDESAKTYNNLVDMQTFYLMSSAYGSDLACLAFQSKLQDLDKSLWTLGQRLDQYRAASEEFATDPYYLDQKRVFNENEVIYLMLLRNLKKECDYKQVIVLFFYEKSQECSKCDDQSYVLTGIKTHADANISIFSFDNDLNITSISLLEKYYHIDQFPCTVVEDQALCGIQSTQQVMQAACTANPNLVSCPAVNQSS